MITWNIKIKKTEELKKGKDRRSGSYAQLPTHKNLAGSVSTKHSVLEIDTQLKFGKEYIL